MTQAAHDRSVPLGAGVQGRAWPWFVAVAAAGVPLGLLWWLLAPGGLNLLTRDPALGAGTNPAVWFPRDLVLAALFLFAGCLVAVLLVAKSRDFSRLKLVLSVLGGLVGALAAWRIGVLAGQWWGGSIEVSANKSIAFSLRSYAVLAIWPASTAAATFVISLVSLLNRAPDDT